MSFSVSINSSIATHGSNLHFSSISHVSNRDCENATSIGLTEDEGYQLIPIMAIVNYHNHPLPLVLQLELLTLSPKLMTGSTFPLIPRALPGFLFKFHFICLFFFKAEHMKNALFYCENLTPPSFACIDI